jgi:hypothetical protein
MTTPTQDTRVDRLYHLLPAIYRMRDADQGLVLQALLRVMAEQVNLVEDDITQLYENWFIETCEDWVVPYIADLIGYRAVLDAGQSGDPRTGEGGGLNRVLIPRREVANTIRYRRRRGTLALLELLARDVAGWPARAVEFYRLLGWSQHVNHLHLDRARTADVRRTDTLDLLDGPFDRLGHSVDVRRISSRRTRGRYNIPSVGVFVWRLQSYSIANAPAYAAEGTGPHALSFSVLGQDAPLFIKEQPETDDAHIAAERNVPAPIRRLAFERGVRAYYGKGRSLAIWADGWAGYPADQPIPPGAIIPADLTGWRYQAPLRHIAVDPVLGRMAFPPSQPPKRGVRVSYHYGFSADTGGGEYSRTLFEPAPRFTDIPDPQDASRRIRQKIQATHYAVGKGTTYPRIADALTKWKQDDPPDAVIELSDSSVYVEPLTVTLRADQTLQLRAANRTRPVIRLLDWQTDLPDALSVTMDAGSRFTLDGVLVTGRPLHVTGPDRLADHRAGPACGAEVVIRHCTLVPGWGIDSACQPLRPAEPSLEMFNVRAALRIEHSIIGSIQVHEDEVMADPIPVEVSDSIVDGTRPGRDALGAPGDAPAHAVLTVRRSTVFGIVDVHAVEMAENSIFTDCMNVAHRQRGCMRFCYVPPGCRTPRRYRCQPDLEEAAVRETVPLAARPSAIAGEQLRVRPQFTSVRYGNPGYGQLGECGAPEIRRGADDESEMGAFHDLFQPQREANLRARLDESTPADMDVGIIFVT